MNTTQTQEQINEQLTGIKIKINNLIPYFSYCTLYSTYTPDKNIPIAAADATGKILYNPEIFNTYDRQQLIFIFAHEIAHIQLKHLLRGKRIRATTQQDYLILNIVTDLWINSRLQENGFKLIADVLLPTRNNYYIIKDIDYRLEDIDKKTIEQMYKEVKDHIQQQPQHPQPQQGQGQPQPQQGQGQQGQGQPQPQQGQGQPQPQQGQGQPQPQQGQEQQGSPPIITRAGHDTHNYINDIAKEEEESEKWDTISDKGEKISRLRGKNPSEIFGEIPAIIAVRSINWLQRLQRAVKLIDTDRFSFKKLNKKSYSYGYAMPTYEKGKYSIIISLDESGSITQENINKFMSQIYRMAQMMNNFKVIILQHDTEIHKITIITHRNKPQIKKLHRSCDGGTSHKAIIDYIREKEPRTKLLISFTDGYSDIEHTFNDSKIRKIIVLSDDNRAEDLKEYGSIITIND